MRKVCLDGWFMGTKEKAHRHIKRRLRLPDYYGNNLDALYDCLSDLPAAQITLRHAAFMRKRLGGEYTTKLLSVMTAATGKNPRITIIVCD